jgi:hypothetical protein
VRGKRIILKVINAFILPIEFIISLVLKRVDANHKQVFIIGSPRSGSTVLSQIFFNQGDFCYISNLTKDLYCAPMLSTYILKMLPKTDHDLTNYISQYGKMSGLNSPHEGGNFWWRWFPRKGELHLERDDLGRKTEKKVRNEVEKIQELHQKTFLSKNLYLSLWIKPLAKIFPKSVFIVCKRDYFAISCSLLEARRKIFRNDETWFSVPPKGKSHLENLEPFQQVAQQPHLIYQQIALDSKEIGANRFHYVQFEDLVANPVAEINKINTFLKRHSINTLDLEIDTKNIKTSSIDTRWISEDERNQLRVLINSGPGENEWSK